MGTFSVAIEIGDPQGSHLEGLEVLADTGSTYTWVPRDILFRLEVDPVGRREFETADGRIIARDVGQTWVRIDARSVITLVVFGDEGSRPLLGAYTREGLGLVPDPPPPHPRTGPGDGKLVAAGLQPYSIRQT